MIYHFELRGEHRWEAMGAGEGQGNDPLSMAIDDLRLLHGGTLPAGRYQYIESVGAGARWREFDLGEDGVMRD